MGWTKMVPDKPKFDVHQRIYEFVVRVIKLVNSLPKTDSNSVIIQQLLRCATSMGANDQEADGALSNKDFVHCYTLVRKETKETNFWLKLIADTNPTIKPKMGPLVKECQEITLIVSAIINKARTNNRKPPTPWHLELVLLVLIWHWYLFSSLLSTPYPLAISYNWQPPGASVEF